MFRITAFVALAALALAGCGWAGGFVEGAAGSDAAPGQVPPQQPAADAPDSADGVKTPLVRALLQTIDEIQGESPEVRDSLRRTLREADKDLGKVLGGKSQQLVLQANQKPAPLVIGGPGRPSAPGPKPPADETPSKPASRAGNEKPGPAAPADDSVKTPMIRALLESVDEAEGDSDDVKRQLKQMLREADEELSRVLGGKSQELILKTNRKHVAPTVAEPRARRSGVKVIEFAPKAGSQKTPGTP